MIGAASTTNDTLETSTAEDGSLQQQYVLNGDEPGVWGSTSNVSIVWAARDADSGVLTTEARVRRAETQDAFVCVTPWRQLSSAPNSTGRFVKTSYTFTGIVTENNKPYVVQLRVFDRAGNGAIRTSCAATFDERPAVPGVILSPSGFVSRPDLLAVTFTPFSGSRIAQHEVCIRSSLRLSLDSLFNCTVVPRAIINRTEIDRAGSLVTVNMFAFADLLLSSGNNVSLLKSIFHLSSGVIIDIRGTNAAGIASTTSSAPLIYDFSPPGLHPDFNADPIGFVLDDAQIAGDLTSVQSGGLMFARVLGDQSVLQYRKTGYPMAATVGSTDLAGIRVAWIGIVDLDSGLVPTGTLVLFSCRPAEETSGIIASGSTNATIDASNTTASAGNTTNTTVSEPAAPASVPSSAFTKLGSYTVPLSDRNYYVQGFAIAPNDAYHASLTVTNLAGASATFTTVLPLTIDVDAPPLLIVHDGFPPNASRPAGFVDPPSESPDDADYWPVIDMVAGSWFAVDPSGIAEYRWAVCRADSNEVTFTPTEACPLPWTAAGTQRSASVSLTQGIRLKPGNAYRTFVRAFDGSGNSRVVTSNGFVVDVTAPDARSAVVSVQNAVASWRDLRITVANLTDPESALAEMQACLTIAAGEGRPSVPLLPCTPISLSLSRPPAFESYFAADSAAAAQADALLADEWTQRLANAGGYEYVNPIRISVDIKAFNRAHLVTVFTAAGVMVDTQPAALLAATAIEGNTMARLNFTSSAPPQGSALLGLPVVTRNTTDLAFVWELAAPKSGGASIVYGLGTECGRADDAAGPAHLDGASISAAFRNLDLRPFTPYYLTLNVTSGAGVTSNLCSAQPVTVDLTPPQLLKAPRDVGGANSTAGVFGTGASAVTVAVTSSSVVAAEWTDCWIDVGTSIASYSVRVCEADGVVCMTDWIDVGSSTNATLSHINLRHGITVRTHVRAFDLSGNFADALTPGLIYDPSPPVPPARIITDPRVIPGWHGLHIEFEPFVDDQSGIAEYLLEILVIGPNSTNIQVLPPTPIGNETVYTLTGVALNATLQGWAERDDGRRPTVGFVQVYGRNRAGLSVMMQGSFKMDTTPPLAGEVAFETVEAAISRPMEVKRLVYDLATGRQIDVSSALSSGAGNNTANGTSYDGSAAVVPQGSRVEARYAQVSLTNPPKYQTTRHALAFVFRGFVDPEQSVLESGEMLSYTYCVGTTPGSDDVIRWARLVIEPFVLVNGSQFKDVSKLPGSDSSRLHTVKLTSLDLPQGAALYASVRATNAAGLFTTVSSKPIIIDATTPQSNHSAPVIDLKARVKPDATVSANLNNMTSTAGYGGVGSGVGASGTNSTGEEIASYADSDWSAGPGALYFAWRGWADSESQLQRIEYSVVELRKEEGYAAEMALEAEAAAPAPAILSVSSSWLEYYASVLGSAVPADFRRRLQTANVSVTTDANSTGGSRWTTFSSSSNSSVNDDYIRGFGTVVPKNESAEIPNYEAFFTADADIRTDVPLQPAFRGQLSSNFLWWGGSPLTAMLAAPGVFGADGALVGTGEVSVEGLPLQRGKAYAVAIRAYSGSSQYTQVLSDGVRVDSARAVPCFGRIQIGTASSRVEPDNIGGILSGEITSAPRPTLATNVSSLLGTLDESAPGQGALVYSPFADKLQLSFAHYADPFIQRPTALQRLYVCPEIDGYGSDLNSKYVGPEDPVDSRLPVPAAYEIALAPIQTYAVRLQLLSIPNSTAATNSTSSSSASNSTGARLLSSARGRLLQQQSRPTSSVAADVPLHETAASFVGASSPCCRAGYEPPVPPAIPTDIELRDISAVRGAGRSLAVVSEQGPASTHACARSYALVGAVGTAMLTPLHHRSGASLRVNASGYVAVAASKVPSGFLPQQSALAQLFQPQQADNLVPAFAVAAADGIDIYEVHTDVSATAAAGLACIGQDVSSTQESGYSLEDLQIRAEAERVYKVASIPAAAGARLGKAGASSVSLHNQTLAFTSTAGSVGVCENAYDPIMGVSRPESASSYAWSTLLCSSVVAPTLPVAAITGSAAVLVPYLAVLDAPAFGSALAVTSSVLAVGAPVSVAALAATPGGITAAGAVLADAVILYQAGPTSDNSSSPSALLTSPLMRSIVQADSGSQLQPSLVLVDPGNVDALAATPASASFRSGFGSAVDLSADGRVMLVSAPKASAGRGRVYAYVFDTSTSQPQLACFVEGGIAGFSRLGEHVQTLAIEPSEDGTIALGVATFHGLARNNETDGAAEEVAASITFSVRALSDAGRAGYQPALNKLDDDASASLGVPRCPIVAIVGAESSLDVRTQLGLKSSLESNLTSAIHSGDLRLKTSGRAVAPVVAASGSSLLLADTFALTWDTLSLAPAPASESSHNLTFQPDVSARSTGRVWHSSLCPRNAVRTKSNPQFAGVPYVCRSCGEGESSFGGAASVCSSCPANNSICAGRTDGTGHATDTLIEVTDEGVQLQHGSMYRVFLRGITAAGRWLERVGPMMQVDTTPPTAPVALDALNGGTAVIDGTRAPSDACTTAECGADVDYINGSSPYLSVFHAGFGEDVSGVAYYAYGASSTPCDGILWKRCVNETVVISAEEGITAVVPTCSPLELDYRARLSARYGTPVNVLGTPGYEIPFDLDDASTSFDIAPLTRVGLATTFSWGGLNLPNGAVVFTCAIAVNGAGLRTAVSSDGFVRRSCYFKCKQCVLLKMLLCITSRCHGLTYEYSYDYSALLLCLQVVDRTAPVIVRGSVIDGFSVDFDQQAMIDGLYAAWQSYDYESNVQAHSWAYVTDGIPHQVLDAYADLEDGLPVDWDIVAASVNTTIVNWESTAAVQFMKKTAVQLDKTKVYYALVVSRH